MAELQPLWISGFGGSSQVGSKASRKTKSKQLDVMSSFKSEHTSGSLPLISELSSWMQLSLLISSRCIWSACGESSGAIYRRFRVRRIQTPCLTFFNLIILCGFARKVTFSRTSVASIRGNTSHCRIFLRNAVYHILLLLYPVNQEYSRTLEKANTEMDDSKLNC